MPGPGRSSRPRQSASTTAGGVELDRLVDGLVRRGYLERTEEVADRRQRVLTLTAEGAAVLAAVDRDRADQFLAVVRPMPMAERALVAMGVAAHRSIDEGRPVLMSEVLGDSWEVAAVATSLGVQPLLDRSTDALSGGQAKRVALAQALVRVVGDDPQAEDQVGSQAGGFHVFGGELGFR